MYVDIDGVRMVTDCTVEVHDADRLLSVAFSLRVCLVRLIRFQDVPITCWNNRHPPATLEVVNPRC